MKAKGYYWARARVVGGDLDEWSLLHCNGQGRWTEFGRAEAIPEADIEKNFAIIGLRVTPPQGAKTDLDELVGSFYWWERSEVQAICDIDIRWVEAGWVENYTYEVTDFGRVWLDKYLAAFWMDRRKPRTS